MKTDMELLNYNAVCKANENIVLAKIMQTC